jgi:hypothetical protein
MKKRRTARTIVVWTALLLLIASWLLTYNDRSWYWEEPIIPGVGGSRSIILWDRLLIMDLTIIAVAAGFLFTFRGGNDK